MDAATARDRAKSELVGIVRITNTHGIELVTDAIAPFPREYRCELPERIRAHAEPDELESVMTFWCVVSGPGGLEVVYDEVQDRFGLAAARKDGLGVVIGWYGTLLDAFRGM